MGEIVSAVGIVESPEDYVVQRRPNLPGRLAYPGMLQLLGGHVESGEDPAAALVRELGEETDLDPNQLDPRHLWTGMVRGRDKRDNPIERQVNLFQVDIPSVRDVRLREEGELVIIRREIEAIQAFDGQYTDFALWALTKHIRRERWR